MTGFVCTLTADAVYVTADGMAVYADPPGDGPISKLLIAPHLPAIVAGSGCFSGLVNFFVHVCQAKDLPSAIADAPAVLGTVWCQLPETERVFGLRCLLAGWADGPVGAVFEYPEFGPQRLEVNGGHCMQPEVSPEAFGYNDLAARWEPAARGVDVETFHAAVIENQAWSVRQGLVTGPLRNVQIGGKIVSARVDGTGIRVQTLGTI